MIVPFLLSDIEEVVEQSQDTAANAHNSVTSAPDMPVLAHLLGQGRTTQLASIQGCQPAVQNIVSSSFPKVTQAVKLNALGGAGEYKFVVVPDDQNIIALQPQGPQQWYVSTGSSSSNPSTVNFVTAPQGLYQVAPQKENTKQVKVLQGVGPPRKNVGGVTLLQPNLQNHGRLLSKGVPVVIVNRDGDSPAAVVQQSGANYEVSHPLPSPAESSGHVSHQSRALPSPADSLVTQQNDDASMPVITSVMSLSNVDFNSIDDNARMVVKNRHVVTTVDNLKQPAASLQKTVLLRKAPHTSATGSSQSLLISNSTSQAGNTADRLNNAPEAGSSAKAVPRIISRPGATTQLQPPTKPVKYILKKSVANVPRRPLLGSVSGPKASERSVTVIGNKVAVTNTSKATGSPVTTVLAPQRDKSNGVGVFELDAVKKVGNTIMGSTITFKPSLEQSSVKESENEKSMIQKLQQAISCFEESALKSNSTFNTEERNMLETVLSNLKGNASQMKAKKEPTFAAPQKIPEGTLSKSQPDEKLNASQSATPGKKPMRRIVITSDTVPSVAAHVVKEGIEAFLLRNNISNDFTEDEILNLHWDGKDISTLYRREEQQAAFPNVVTVNDNTSAMQPATVRSSPDQSMKLEFKPRVIRVIKKNGEVVERTLGDNCPSLPVLTNQHSTSSPVQSSSNSPATQAAPVSQALNSTRLVKVLPPPPQPPQPREPVSQSKQTAVAKQPLQTLLSDMRDKSSEDKQLRYVTALFPDGQLRKIAISGIQVRKEPAKKSDSGNTRQEPKIKRDRTLDEQKTGSVENSSSECDISNILEPEVVLEESNTALNYSASELSPSSSSSSSSESDSSFNCNSESEESDEEDLVQEWSPSRRASDRQTAQPQQSPQQKRKRRPPDPYRKRRRYAARRRGKKVKVDEGTGPEIEPIAARLRYANARATVVVNCTNCIANPCIVVMDRLDDDVVKTGRVNLELYKEPELFALSATPKVTLNSSRVVEAVKLQQVNTKGEEPAGKAPVAEPTDLMQMLLDSRKQLEELRKKYQ
ncbi:ras guanine nucleotide exchange factor Y-like isoform X2 [Ornithodoros turicata]